MRSDYERHTLYFVAAIVVTFLAVTLCMTVRTRFAGIGAGAPLFFLSGWKAVVAKRSALTSGWQRRGDLDAMSPESRAGHGVASGVQLMLLAVGLAALELYLAFWR